MAQFNPIGKKSVSQAIIDQIMEQIGNGSLRPGERFPSERQLCEQFEVGRSSVREAMVTLKAMGVVKSKNKITVLNDDQQKMNMQTLNDLNETFSNIKDVLEARKILEGEIILLAADRATETDMANIESHIKETEDLLTYAELDQKFHIAIAAAAHNQVIYTVYKMMLERLFSTYTIYTEAKSANQESYIEMLISEGVKSHKELFEALKSGNKKLAKTTLIKHLNSAEMKLFSSMGG